MVGRFSINWLCCRSSEHKMLQLASKAEAIIILSNSWKSYRLIKIRALSIISWLIGMISHCDITLLHFSKISLFGNFCNRFVTFKNSEITCALIKGLSIRSDSLISLFLSSKESNRYIKTFVAKVKLLIIIIGFVTVKFKVAQINKIVFKNFADFRNFLLPVYFQIRKRFIECFYVFLSIAYRLLINLKSDHFNSFANQFIRQIKHISITGGHYNFPDQCVFPRLTKIRSIIAVCEDTNNGNNILANPGRIRMSDVMVQAARSSFLLCPFFFNHLC